MLWQEDQTGEKETKKENSVVSTSMNYGAASFSAPKTTASFWRWTPLKARGHLSPQGDIWVEKGIYWCRSSFTLLVSPNNKAQEKHVMTRRPNWRERDKERQLRCFHQHELWCCFIFSPGDYCLLLKVNTFESARTPISPRATPRFPHGWLKICGSPG